jgi:hypothetical protein
VFKIQQRVLLFFWTDYHGFAVKRDDGVIDITLESQSQAEFMFEAVKKQAELKHKKDKWTVVSE